MIFSENRYPLFRIMLWLMQPRRLEQLGPICRGQHDVEGDTLVVNRERYVDARRAKRPELAIEAGLARDLFALHGQDDVAGLEFGARRGSFLGDADRHDLVVDLG